ncbi:hypothetical protein I203_104620 [Kwoniella mangroviensis CBS 8507]|uniref:uncharacterized protein n=1 Tax=Kwoniella mangroviensis CBS 8507 TaxID=1296122 RepID=UPI00080D6D1D|nr:uncharacterized protein I203_00434 [Kwoniella mangroviensis CBS 8507]OCF70301.1 hypothetical protein I203_00434 [Kwoniella mangroviensis CBS 8507]
MKPSPTLIPRLLPILKHHPIPSSSSTSASFAIAASRSAPAQHINQKKVEQIGTGTGWSTWWLSNPSVKHINDDKIRKSPLSNSHSHHHDHDHLQTSLNYHNSISYRLEPTAVTDNIRSTPIQQSNNSKSKGNATTPTSSGNGSGDTSTVPPPTIAWNDYLSMV